MGPPVEQLRDVRRPCRRRAASCRLFSLKFRLPLPYVLPYVAPEGTRLVLLDYPGLTPWAKLFRPVGALSSQLSTLAHRPESNRFGQPPRQTTTYVPLANDLLMFLTKRLNLDIHA